MTVLIKFARLTIMVFGIFCLINLAFHLMFSFSGLIGTILFFLLISSWLVFAFVDKNDIAY